MSILMKNIRLFASSVRSDARSTNSKTNNPVCTTLLAGSLLFSGGAMAQNVLVNPGAETGDLTGWTVSDTGYINAISTNTTINGAGTGYVLAHSGKYVFRLFDTTGAEGEPTASIYQDFAADSGSQWSASCWAIEFASNYPSSGIAYMSVAFFDISNNVLNDTNLGSPYGVYGSDVLDPTSGGIIDWIILPPPATNPTGWLYLPATNFYYGYNVPVTTVNPPPEVALWVESGNEFPESTTLIAPPGTVKVRYQLEYDNSADNGGAVYFDDCVLDKLVGSDPDITNPPVAVTVLAGGAASFTVGPKTSYVGEKLKYQWQFNGTNLPAAGGGHINGNATSQSLTITNCQASDQGLYDVVVTDINTHVSPSITNSIMSVPVPLTVQVLSPLQRVNALGVNAGFEQDPIWLPWSIFNGCYFATTNQFFDAGDTTPVNVFDGNVCAEVGVNGDRDNGFWQAPSTTAPVFGSLPIAPGTWWKAGGWAYISSSNDMTDGNTCRLQIWFKDADGNTVPGTPTYESYKLYGLAYTNANEQYVCIDASSSQDGQTLYHTFLPRDHWTFLQVSNVVNNAGIGLEDDLPYNTLPQSIFMVPTNTTPAVAEINFQVYEYCPQSTDIDPATGQPLAYLGNATDAVYWDDMELIQVLPVTNVTVSVKSNAINLSFQAQAGLNYSVVYKTNLTDAAWTELTDVAAPWSWQTNVLSVGISTNVTVSDPITAQSRFYQVQTH